VGATGSDDLVQGSHGGVGVDGVVDDIGERLAGELVDDVEILMTRPVAVTSNWFGELALQAALRFPELPPVQRTGGLWAIMPQPRLRSRRG
jgi:hypothetical protein